MTVASPTTLPSALLCSMRLCSILSDSQHSTHLSAVQACLDAVAVAASTAEARTHEGVLDTVLEDIFSLLLRMRGTLRDSSELEDAPRAVLSLMLQSGDAIRGGMQIGAREGHVGVRVEGLLLGAVLSLGGPSSNPRGSSASEGGSEGCAYRYSSLLRLSLYLSTVPETVLQTLVPALFRRGTAWPKVILKAFSHLYSSRRIALDPRMPYSAAAATATAAPPLSATPSKSSLVRIVLEVRQLHIAKIETGRTDICYIRIAHSDQMNGMPIF